MQAISVSEELAHGLEVQRIKNRTKRVLFHGCLDDTKKLPWEGAAKKLRKQTGGRASVLASSFG